MEIINRGIIVKEVYKDQLTNGRINMHVLIDILNQDIESIDHQKLIQTIQLLLERSDQMDEATPTNSCGPRWNISAKSSTR
jgi:hypothetical protein